MGAIHLYSHECLLCLKEIGEEVTYAGSSLLKLLDIEVGSVGYEDRLFCADCASRNKLISRIFSQIETLQNKLNVFKGEIEADLRSSDEILRGRSIEDWGRMEFDVKPSSKECLRFKINQKLLNPGSAASELGPVTEGSDHEGEQDDWADSHSPLELLEAAPMLVEPSAEAILVSKLKKSFGVREEIRISLRKLPRQLSDKRRLNINSLPSYLWPKQPQKISCIFKDCPSKEFKTETARKRHMKLAHGFEASPVSSTVSDSDSRSFLDSRKKRNGLVQPSHSGISSIGSATIEDYPKVVAPEQRNNFISSAQKFKCIFADCESDQVINSAEERDLHMEKEHQFKSVDLPPVRFQCIFADCQSFETEDARETHVQTEHPDFVPLRRRGRRRRAGRNSSPGGSNPVEEGDEDEQGPKILCDVEGCPRRRSFPNETELEYHKQKFHEGVTHPYKCTACDRFFRKKTNRTEHYKAVHMKLKKLMCHICGQKFSQSINLKRHLTTHTGEKNYGCDFCERKFKTKESSMVHKRYAHTGERPYSCDRCGKTYVTTGHLTKHIKCVHNPQERPYICDVCGKSFPIFCYLKMHIKNSHLRVAWPSKQNPKKKGVRKRTTSVEGLPAADPSVVNSTTEDAESNFRNAGFNIPEAPAIYPPEPYLNSALSSTVKNDPLLFLPSVSGVSHSIENITSSSRLNNQFYPIYQ